MKHIYTKQDANGRWHFGFKSILHPGFISWSLGTWSTEAEAKRAAKR